MTALTRLPWGPMKRYARLETLTPWTRVESGWRGDWAGVEGAKSERAARAPKRGERRWYRSMGAGMESGGVRKVEGRRAAAAGGVSVPANTIRDRGRGRYAACGGWWAARRFASAERDAEEARPRLAVSEDARAHPVRRGPASESCHSCVSLCHSRVTLGGPPHEMRGCPTVVNQELTDGAKWLACRRWCVQNSLRGQVVMRALAQRSVSAALYG